MTEPISDKDLEKLERELAKLYPNIDFSKDPAEELLSGEYDEEIGRRIAEFLDEDDAGAEEEQ